MHNLPKKTIFKQKHESKPHILVLHFLLIMFHKYPWTSRYITNKTFALNWHLGLYKRICDDISALNNVQPLFIYWTVANCESVVSLNMKSLLDISISCSDWWKLLLLPIQIRLFSWKVFFGWITFTVCRTLICYDTFR